MVRAMLRSILLALDDTPGALAARDLAFALARKTGAGLTAAIVLDAPHTRDLHEPVPLGAGAFAVHRNAKLAEAVEQEAEQVLAAARAAGQDLRFEVVRREEAPEPALLAEGARHDLIVIGRDSTLGREASEDGLSPCIEALIADGVRPLLVVPPGVAPDAAGPVLLGYRETAAAMRTVQLFALLGLGRESEVKLLDFSPEGRAGPGIAGYLARHGCAASAARAEGEEHDVLLAEARSLPARLLVLGAEEEGRLARLILGSATARLLRAAPCPVFIHG
ncbi:MAG: universal stress protein [Roseococcus sp.]|nr:universal stress protein [Roseococcus sp.]